MNLQCWDVLVDSVLDFQTDHRLIWAAAVLPLPEVSGQRTPCIRNWKPASGWQAASEALAWNWDEWDTTIESWRLIALANFDKPAKQRDEILCDLLRSHKHSPLEARRSLNRQIWRRRRWLKRQKAKQALHTAGESGRFPSTGPKNISVNWSKICGEGDPASCIYEFFADIYSLSPSEREGEALIKEQHVCIWRTARLDSIQFRVTEDLVAKAVNKLKNGRGSPDGCTAEMYKALPATALTSLALFFTGLFSGVVFPGSWTTVGATLIPKVVGATCLSKFRAISCLPVARKLCGYLWLQMLPTLRFDSFQCGFIPGSHAANGVYVIKRAFELSKEWGLSLFVAQLDLKKAFDRVLHSAVINALLLQQASAQCIAVIISLLQQSTASVSLGHCRAASVGMERGLPQGAPESPLLFVLITEFVLRPLLHRWRERGSGWCFSGLHISAVCYADDIILLSLGKKDLVRMISEVIEQFASVGLEVSSEKCHWTSYPARPQEKLRFNLAKVTWESSLIFVGTVLSCNSSDKCAMEYRLAQATKVFHKWKGVLQCKSTPLVKRISLAGKTVFAAALWLSETWYPTKTQRKYMNSWAARITSQIVGIRMGEDESVGDFWRRMYRTGHEKLRLNGGSLDFRRRQRVHSFAGHIARDPESLAGMALRTRSLSWWRFYQEIGANRHPQRFHPWRWEAQLEDFYGVAVSLFVDEPGGWIQMAQDRQSWKLVEGAFAAQVFA